MKYSVASDSNHSYTYTYFHLYDIKFGGITLYTPLSYMVDIGFGSHSLVQPFAFVQHIIKTHLGVQCELSKHTKQFGRLCDCILFNMHRSLLMYSIALIYVCGMNIDCVQEKRATGNRSKIHRLQSLTNRIYANALHTHECVCLCVCILSHAF